MEKNIEKIDLDALYRAVLAHIESMDEALWKGACHGIATGVFGACEAFGAPSRDGVMECFGKAMSFDDEGANELAGEIGGWAGGLEERDLADSFEWREAYTAAVSAAAPETFANAVALVRGFASEELGKLE